MIPPLLISLSSLKKSKNLRAIGEQPEEQQNTMLAGKFENAEQLEKAYLELQQKMGEGKEEAEPEAEEVQESDPDYLAQAMNEYQDNWQAL